MKITDVKTDLTRESLMGILRYIPESGIFTWVKPPAHQTLKSGDLAGYLRDNGYWYIKINRRAYSAHRLAWLYVHGEWPTHLIDHINGIKSDNRIENLRQANKSQNCANGKLRTHNTSGLKGVSKFKNKWRAQITHNQVVIYLGLFNTKEEAHEAYLQAAQRLHGEFAKAA